LSLTVLTETTQEFRTRIHRTGDTYPWTAEHICLLVAAIAGTVAMAAWLVDVSNPAPNDFLRGLGDMSRAIACLAVLGYLIRSAEGRARHTVATRLADAEQAHAQG